MSDFHVLWHTNKNSGVDKELVRRHKQLRKTGSCGWVLFSHNDRSQTKVRRVAFIIECIYGRHAEEDDRGLSRGSIVGQNILTDLELANNVLLFSGSLLVFVAMVMESEEVTHRIRVNISAKKSNP